MGTSHRHAPVLTVDRRWNKRGRSDYYVRCVDCDLREGPLTEPQAQELMQALMNPKTDLDTHEVAHTWTGEVLSRHSLPRDEEPDVTHVPPCPFYDGSRLCGSAATVKLQYAVVDGKPTFVVACAHHASLVESRTSAEVL